MNNSTSTPQPLKNIHNNYINNYNIYYVNTDCPITHIHIPSGKSPTTGGVTFGKSPTSGK